MLSSLLQKSLKTAQERQQRIIPALFENRSIDLVDCAALTIRSGS
jgi:hypothetical protein